uniref:Uncharacterized protein n=1 Tax=Plectus sambesii TaxID=2011161 RepID=A0A914WTX3_9BILA
MPSPPLPTDMSPLMAELERIALAKSKIEEFDARRTSLADEIRRCKEGDSSLDDFRKLLHELTQEKMSHVEELRQINSDINTIEEAIKQTESDRQRAFETARRLLNETMRLKDQANVLGRNAGATELLADPVIPQEDLTKLMLDQQLRIAAPASNASSAFGQLMMGSGDGGFTVMSQGLPTMVPYDPPRLVDSVVAGGSSNAASNSAKHQPLPPMKASFPGCFYSLSEQLI